MRSRISRKWQHPRCTWRGYRRPGRVIAVIKFPQRLAGELNSIVDWFIPHAVRAQDDLLPGARMFLFSHLFGPFLGHTISFSMLFLAGTADWHWWVFFAAVTAFWPLSFILRW